MASCFDGENGSVGQLQFSVPSTKRNDGVAGGGRVGMTLSVVVVVVVVAVAVVVWWW